MFQSKRENFSLTCWFFIFLRFEKKVFIPLYGKKQSPCGMWRCRKFYMHPPDRVCISPTLTAGSLCTAPLPPPASQSHLLLVELPPGKRIKNLKHIFIIRFSNLSWVSSCLFLVPTVLQGIHEVLVLLLIPPHHLPHLLHTVQCSL